MKSFKNYIACMTILVLLFTSCSKDDENGTAPDPEKSTLSFGTVLNDLVSNRSALKQELSGIPDCSDDLPAFVEVMISQEGVPVVGTVASPLRVNVNPNPGNFDGDGQDEYFTDESATLQLEPGIYNLEYFKVLNEDLEVIWIAPVQDDLNQNFSGFVDNPLPIEINLRAGTKKYVNVEVLCFDNRFVNNYGYLFFEFEGTEAIKFCIFGNYCDETGRHAEAVRYMVNVYIYSGNVNSPSGAVLYENIESGIVIEDDFENGISTVYSVPLCFALPDRAGLDEYYFEITLLSGAGYNIEDQIIRRGVITDEDVRSLFVGDGNLDYYHFREGNCNLEDSPNLFTNDGVECNLTDPDADCDGDGVINNLDECEGSASGIVVNNVGCEKVTVCTSIDFEDIEIPNSFTAAYYADLGVHILAGPNYPGNSIKIMEGTCSKKVLHSRDYPFSSVLFNFTKNVESVSLVSGDYGEDEDRITVTAYNGENGTGNIIDQQTLVLAENEGDCLEFNVIGEGIRSVIVFNQSSIPGHNNTTFTDNLTFCSSE